MRPKVFFKAVKKMFQTVKLFRLQNLTRCGDYLPRTNRTNFLFSLLAVEQCIFQHPIIISSRVYKKTSQVSRFPQVHRATQARKRNNKSLFRLFLNETGCTGECRLTYYDRNTSFNFRTNKRNAARHDCHEVKS